MRDVGRADVCQSTGGAASMIESEINCTAMLDLRRTKQQCSDLSHSEAACKRAHVGKWPCRFLPAKRGKPTRCKPSYNTAPLPRACWKAR